MDKISGKNFYKSYYCWVFVLTPTETNQSTSFCVLIFVHLMI